MIRYQIEGDNEYSSVILRYISKINKIKTSPLRPTELLIALKNLWYAKSSLLLGIRIITIE